MPKSLARKPSPKIETRAWPRARRLARVKSQQDLYSGLDDPAIKRDLGRADAECAAFEEAFKGKLAGHGALAGGRRQALGASRAAL